MHQYGMGRVHLLNVNWNMQLLDSIGCCFAWKRLEQSQYGAPAFP